MSRCPARVAALPVRLRPGPPSGPRAALAAGVLIACLGPPPPIELAGCAEVDATTCTWSADQPITLWAAEPTQVWVDHGRVEGPWAADGWRWQVHPEPEARRLQAGRALTLRPPRDPDPGDEITRLLRQGSLTAAREALAAWDSPDPARQASLQARVALHAGDIDAAVAAWEQAITGYTSSGRPRAALDDRLALVWTLRTHRRAAGTALLARLDEASIPPIDGDAAARHAYHRALVQRDQGDLRGALGGLQQAAAHAERLGMDRVARDAHAARAVLLASLGQSARAEVELGLLPVIPEESACDQADRHTNTGWVRWLAWQSGRGPLDPYPFEQAAALYRTTCPRAGALANAEVNLGLVAWAGGDHAAATAALGRARAASPRPPAEVRAWADELEARLAVAAGDHAHARAVWRSLEVDASSAGLDDLAWRAACGLAELAPPAEARGAWQHAEDRLDALASTAPLGEGRETLLGEHDRSAMGLVDVLLRAGEIEAALQAARRARLRSLRALAAPWRAPARDEALLAWQQVRARAMAEAAEDWAQPGSEAQARRARRTALLDEARRAALDALGTHGAPPPLAPLPDLTLVIAPVPDGVVTWASHRGQVQAKRSGPVSGDPDALGRALLDPWDAWLEATDRVHLLVSGPLREADLHAATWRGAPLHRQRPVVWTLDIGRASARGATGEVLVVGDPRGDLPWARREAEQVAARLGTTALLGRDATWERLTARLSTAAVAHLAGHGEGAGWEGALRLAVGGLEVADVLSLPQVPARVVLSACGTAADAGTVWDGVGLAQAFILAGSTQVVASRAAVSDAQTAQLGPALHEGADFAVALQRAAGDIGAWRVIEP